MAVRRKGTETLLSELNQQQREAVLHEGGPLLVLAGAGSGKTRVITYRIAHLIHERGVAPRNILAITFTNKAADEMRARVTELVGELENPPWISTFHSFCARVLRRYIPAIGFPSTFSIYDVSDQVSLIRKVIKEIGINSLNPADLQSSFSTAKNGRTDPAETLGRLENPQILQVFKAYQKALKAAGALDFDDLLLRTIELFEQREDVLTQHRNRFEHILVDEYQDTNHPQFRLVSLLAPPQLNVCAVGDDDQSIYRWRGADIENILRFERDFESVKIVKLEQNYRSTQSILDAAHGVVESLAARHEKKLWTDRSGGELVNYFLAENDTAEAAYIVTQVHSHLSDRRPSEIAVLFRTHAQSRPFEEAFTRQRIPFQLIGGTRFYERAEIRDVLAYMQLGMNHNDIVNLRRIINTPARGIGEGTVGKLEFLASQRGTTVWEALDKFIPYLDANVKAKNTLTLFKEMIAAIGEHVEHGERPSEVIDFILKESGYLGSLIKDGSKEALDRLDNLRELIASAKAFEEANADAGVESFLDQAALVSESDAYEAGSEKVTLMTLHNAKGLEFGLVFLAGLEDGLLPHIRNINNPQGLEEERRLFYVGMTRARDLLYLTGARARRTYTGINATKPSRFLDDIPPAALLQRGGERRTRRRKTTVGANIDSIGKFFKDRKIDIDIEKLKKKQKSPGGAEFGVGDRIEVTKYGVGKIVAIEGEGDELRYTVHFRGIGRKKLLARVAKLKRVP
jgi:DNA helicase-2/ATP-dependent DNA helicase PcrA